MIAFFKSKFVRYASLLSIAGALSVSTATPAAAQSSDAWKSAAIIGGTTIAGAVIGGKVAGKKGALIGGAAGATTGYVIDRHRRQSEYNNYYGNDGYYGPNGYSGGNSNEYQGQDRYYPSNQYGYRGNSGGYYRGNR